MVKGEKLFSATKGREAGEGHDRPHFETICHIKVNGWEKKILMYWDPRSVKTNIVILAINICG